MLTIVNRCAKRILTLSSAQRSVAVLSTDVEKNEANKKKKKPPEIRINLIENRGLTVLSLEGAKKLAAKKGFQLVPVDKPLHWMSTGNRTPYEFLAPSKKVSKGKDSYKAKGFKGLKTTIFSTSIQENDIITKINQLCKWISNGYVIEVAIDVSDLSNSIRARVEESIKDEAKLPGTIKRDSKTFFRVQYEPLIKETQTEDPSVPPGN